MKIGIKVTVTYGRSKGMIGTVIHASEDLVCVSFGREILVHEGFGSYGYYPDSYWMKEKFAIPA